MFTARANNVDQTSQRWHHPSRTGRVRYDAGITSATMDSRRSSGAMALTDELVARVSRVVQDTGLPAIYSDMSVLTADDKLALAERLLRENSGAEFWVFGYGSLIWKPAFDYVEARRVVAHGWRRDFSLVVHSWRGTEEQPGLMLALERGGSCTGVAYKMSSDEARDQMLRFVEREADYHEDAPTLRWITVRDGNKAFRALTSWVAVPGNPYFLRLSIAEQAQMLARAVGHFGSCAEYLRNTVTHLEAMGIRDNYLWRLQQLVADEIKALHPKPGDRALVFNDP
jgi:cation transport protein ChaC